MEQSFDLGHETFLSFLIRGRTDFRDSVAFIRAEVHNWAGR